VNYSLYPEFAGYPGSTRLRVETAHDMLVIFAGASALRSEALLRPDYWRVDAARSETRHGVLATDGILLQYANKSGVGADTEGKQAG
jgi:hypothetical protein